MKKTNHIILIVSLMAFVWCEVTTYPALYSTIHECEKLTESELETKTEFITSSFRNLPNNQSEKNKKATFINPFIIKSERVNERRHDSTEKLFIAFRTLLI